MTTSVKFCLLYDPLKWNFIAFKMKNISIRFGWLVVLGLTALWDSISVYIGPSPKEREKEERKDRGEEKCPNNPLPAPTASAIGPCPTIIQIVGRPGTGSLHRTIAPPYNPHFNKKTHCWYRCCQWRYVFAPKCYYTCGHTIIMTRRYPLNDRDVVW